MTLVRAHIAGSLLRGRFKGLSIALDFDKVHDLLDGLFRFVPGVGLLGRALVAIDRLCRAMDRCKERGMDQTKRHPNKNQQDFLIFIPTKNCSFHFFLRFPCFTTSYFPMRLVSFPGQYSSLLESG